MDGCQGNLSELKELQVGAVQACMSSFLAFSDWKGLGDGRLPVVDGWAAREDQRCPGQSRG